MVRKQPRCRVGHLNCSGRKAKCTAGATPPRSAAHEHDPGMPTPTESSAEPLPDYSEWVESYRKHAEKRATANTAVRSVKYEIGQENGLPVIAHVHTWGDDTYSVSVAATTFTGYVVTDTLFRKPGSPDSEEIRAAITQWQRERDSDKPKGVKRFSGWVKSLFDPA